MADSTGLAFVCASIGGLQADEDGIESYVKSPECLESLRDLQRYLRRDNPETRDVFLELGKWNVVRQDLVPLIKSYSDDFEIVLNCVKILVFLTMPAEPTSEKVSKQVEYLQHFKAAIVEGDAIAVIVSHLEEPLQNLESGCPKDDDWKLFQLFLTLLRNVLSVPDCSPQLGPSSPEMSNLRDQMLERLFNESAIELVVVLTQHVAGHGGLRQDNLLILEIIQQVFWGQSADQVAAGAPTAAPAADKGAKQSEKSAATLRAVLQSEREQLKRLRKGSSPFTGMFVQVARDGSKTMVTRNPHQSPLENLIRKPQVKRGVIKRIVQDPLPVFQSSDQIYVLLKDFADQFLASGYNILMQSVKEDIQRERRGLETPEIVAFFQVAQFFTAYQCCAAQRDQVLAQFHNSKVPECVSPSQCPGRSSHTTSLGSWSFEKHQVKPNDGSLDGAEKEAAARKHLCGLIASTMDEATFKIVKSKWLEFADLAKEIKDWKPLAAAGGLVKDMIKMLDLVLKRSGSLTREGKQELRTARTLLYIFFYDDTDDGVLHLLNSLIKSFDIYKQPRSHLADLVEITHIVLRILDSFAKSGESLRVLIKVRGGWKRKPKPSEKSPAEGAEQDATEAKADEKAPESATDGSHSPKHTSVSSPNANVDPERLGEEGIAENVAAGDERTEDQSEVELQKKSSASPHQEDEEDETFNTSPVAPAAAHDDDDGDDSDGGKQNRTKEVTLNIRKVVDKYANNDVVRNYCWLLKFHSTNRAAINHYIVRMLQRICDDCHLEPILYQISILQTFHSVLSNKQLQAAEDHRYVIAFLSKVVRRLFKKLETQPILFLDIIFWKSRSECHHITADYMIHSLRKDTGGSSQNRKRINIADALGDDEVEVPTNRDSDDEESSSSSEDEDAEAIILFSEDQEVQIKELFERFKDDEQYAQLIASELDAFEKYTAAQVQRKLRSLGLVKRSTNRSKKKIESGGDKCKKGQSSLSSQSPNRNQKSRRASDGSGARKKSNLFSEAQDQALTELFERHGSGKNVTKVITENMGGEFTTAQVSRRLRILGLVKPKPRTALSSLHANLTDSEEDYDNLPRMVNDLFSQEEGNKSVDRRGKKRALKRRINTEDLPNGDDDQEDTLGSGPSSHQEGLASPVRQEGGRSRKRRIESVELFDSDDDDAPLTRLVRSGPAPGQGKTISEDVAEEDHPRIRTNIVDLEDSEDDALITAGIIKPARIKERAADPADHMQEKHSRGRRVESVELFDSDDDDDAPLASLVRSAPASGQGKTTSGDLVEEDHPRRRTNTADLEDSEDDALITSGVIKPEWSKEGAADPANHIQKKHSGRRRVESVELFDSDDDDAPLASLVRSAPAPGQGKTTSGDLVDEDRPRRRTNTADLEDSEDDTLKIKPARSKEGVADPAGHIQEKHSRRRVESVELFDSDDDAAPLASLVRSAPALSQGGITSGDLVEEDHPRRRTNTADLEDSEGDALVSSGNTLGIDNFEDLEDSEDDVHNNGAEGLLGSTGDKSSRKRKRVTTIDLSDSEDEGPLVK